MTASKQLFHVVTYESGEKYSFYLTADVGIQNTEIEKRLLSHYERENHDRVFLTFGHNMNHDNKTSGFHIYISNLDSLDDRVLKNIREHSPDELTDIRIFEYRRPFR